MQAIRNFFRGVTVLEVVIMSALVAIVPAALLGGTLIDEDVAVHALETQGFTGVKVIDKAWFAVGLRGCDKNDSVRFTASATNPAGKEVQLYVCGGIFKGATVRTY